MSAHSMRWKIEEPAPKDFGEISGHGPILSTLLHQRGLQTTEEIHHFLHRTYPNGLHDPFLMKGMSEASQRIAKAIAEKESIAVYGDYDTDGVTAVTLLKQSITAMGGNIIPYIPHRKREGYGLNEEAIRHLADKGTQLLITVDCGITNVREVALATSLGLDVIVTDHHTPPEELPQALAVVNPKRHDCTYPYKQLVGVGIAFKLVQALVKQGLRPAPRGRDVLDLVALGTVADVGPLDGENRVLVKAGLEALNMTQRPGLLALIKSADLLQGKVDALAIGFRLAPRLNAAGRLDDARDAYELLLADDLTKALELAYTLNVKNRQRQQMTDEVKRLAKKRAEMLGKQKQKIVLIEDVAYPSGIVGLVAAKLVEEWGRPVILLERGEEISVGSARSIPGFDIIQALRMCEDLFERFGGHSRAAGLSIKNERLPELERRLLDIANEQLVEEMLKPTLIIHADVHFQDLHWESYQELSQLEPFGEKNPQPVLMTRGLLASDIRAIGSQEQHLKFRLSLNGSNPLDAIAFRLGHLAEPLRKHPWIDVAYTLESHEWNNQYTLQLNVKDFRRISQNSG